MLLVHRAERADDLADTLAVLLAEPLDDPLAAEVVSVPTRGMERWLTQRLSSVLGASHDQADGICANIEFPFPHRLITEAIAAASGIDPASDPWLPERATWPLLEVVQACLEQPWLASLSSYLGGGSAPPDRVKQARRLSTVRHLATLFDRYALHRPMMLEAWAQGQDADADGNRLPSGAVWQAELWRRLRARIGLPGPAERRQRGGERLTEDPSIATLPQRFSLFGLTRLPAGHVQILKALAHGRDVHLFLLHPSPALWAEVEQRPTTAGAPRRADDPTAQLPANRLLASWGRDAREMQVVLRGAGIDSDDHREAFAQAPTLLGQIQSGIRANRAPPGPPLAGEADQRPVLQDADRSIEIHSCHGRARQVEVVRDAILHALAQDESLEPRDVIVMCPDIEAFAPLIQATFGAGDSPGIDDGTELVPADVRPIDLRVRLADRSLRQTNAALSVVSQLLELAEGRLTASQVLDLADRAPVRRRFRLDDDDLAKMQEWISQAGIRWGLDAGHRAPYQLDQVPNGTWRDGLDRILLGVTMTEDGERQFERVLPLDDVGSRSIDLAGRMAELIARLGEAVDALGRRQPLSAWATAIGEAADSLTDASFSDRWQRAELQRVLDDMVDEAADRAGGPGALELAPQEIRSYLHQRLAGRPTRANFRTGHLTICTLMPMRSVPHRVVCLLGLDDGAFPRKAPRDGDDLMLDDPHIGERDPRSEDRQLLLDALLAATERLIVTYSGNDERTNTRKPPAVPLGELLDIAQDTVRTRKGSLRDRILVCHPLQPFDPRNFSGGALVPGRTWSFDPVTLQGARALEGPRLAPRPFLSEPLPQRSERVLELADLVRFVEHPVRAFLRRRLGIGLLDGSDEIEDALRIELDPLERWDVGRRLLEARLAGVDGRTAIRAEIARGDLPPGQLGKRVIDDVYPRVDEIVERAKALTPPGAHADTLEVRVRLEDGRLLSGTVAGVRGGVILTTTYSRIAAKHRLAAWVRLLALTASRPQQPLSAATVGRGSGDDVRVAVIGPLAADPDVRATLALAQLTRLVDLLDRGMREPLPLVCATSAAYAEAARNGRDPHPDAEAAWTSEWNFEHEDRELEHRLAFGGVMTFQELLAQTPPLGESGDGWAHEDPTRLGRLARRLWDPLLDHEKTSSR